MNNHNVAPSMLQLLRGLWSHVSMKRRWQLLLVVVLMVFSSIAEIFSIGAVLPFLGVLTSPKEFFNQPSIEPLIKLLKIRNSQELLLVLTLAFCITTLLATAARYLTVMASTRLSFGIGFDLSSNAYRRVLYQPYLFHVSLNSSEILSSINKASMIAESIILPILNVCSSLVMMFGIMGALILINPLLAFGTFGGFGTLYAIIIKLGNKKLIAHSKSVATHSSRVTKSLQEGLGGIRDIALDGSQEIFVEAHEKSDKAYRYALGSNMLISNGPHYLVEAIGIVLMVLAAYWLADNQSGLLGALPTIGALVLGAQRLLPVLHKLYSSWTNIRFGRYSLADALFLLDLSMPKELGRRDQVKPMGYKKEICFKNVFFRYSDETRWILQDLNLTIPKGASVGFIGKTGEGKSTLLDLLMGFLSPSKGHILVDNMPLDPKNLRSWQSRIAHVPQSIYLADISIAENIAFGVPSNMIDYTRVARCAEIAMISEVIETLPASYMTVVGERGVRLSGGQRQRIGIARALYKNADIMIFDEATSSLDNETEELLISSISKISDDKFTQPTILMIAHRLTTLKNCDFIVNLEGGKISDILSYRDLIKLKEIGGK